MSCVFPQLLIAQVQSLNSKLEALQTLSLGTDDSDDDGDDDDEDEVLDDDHYVKLESLSSSNSPTKAAAKDENKVNNICPYLIYETWKI